MVIDFPTFSDFEKLEAEPKFNGEHAPKFNTAHGIQLRILTWRHFTLPHQSEITPIKTWRWWSEKIHQQWININDHEQTVRALDCLCHLAPSRTFFWSKESTCRVSVKGGIWCVSSQPWIRQPTVCHLSLVLFGPDGMCWDRGSQYVDRWLIHCSFWNRPQKGQLSVTRSMLYSSDIVFKLQRKSTLHFIREKKLRRVWKRVNALFRQNTSFVSYYNHSDGCMWGAPSRPSCSNILVWWLLGPPVTTSDATVMWSTGGLAAKATVTYN